jgi:ABC-type bacteriocin/lantibiotic exporter with double-glycine peptidase domain
MRVSFKNILQDDRKKILSGYKRRGLEIIGGSLLLNLFGVLTPVYSMLVYDKVVGNNIPETLAGLTLGAVLIVTINFVLRLLRSYYMEKIFCESDQRIDRDISRLIMQMQNGAVHASGRFISKYHDLQQTRDIFSASYMMALVDVPFLLIYLLILTVIGGPLIWWVLFMVGCVAVFSLAVKKPANRAGMQAQALEAQRLSLLSEILNHADLIKVSQLRDFILGRWDGLSETSAQARSKGRFYNAISYAGLGDGMTLLWVGTICFGALLAEQNSLSIGGLSACSLLSSRIGSAVGAFIMLLGRYELFVKARDEFNQVVEGESEQKQFMPPRQLQGIIGVDHLSFHFPGRTDNALHDVTLRIGPGEKVGVLGRNGSGKSTLLRCLAGVLAPQTGQVTVDGVHLQSFDPSWRAQWLSYKPQDALLFEGTLEDNLRGGDRSEDVSTLHAALAISGLADEIARGEMTLDKAILSGGNNLSGGQRQAVALARALLPNPAILLLDEPTAGLDRMTEQLITERLLSSCKQKTLIIATHSLDLLQKLDRIIVVEKGRIIADGPTQQIIVGAA